MSNADAWAVIVGVVMPFIISTLKNAAWPKQAKFALALGLSLVGGGLTAYFGGQLVFSWERALVDAAIVFTAAQAFYKLWIEDSQVDRLLTEGPK